MGAEATDKLNKAYSMTWAQRLKRVFAIEIEKGEKCGEKCGGNAGRPPREIVACIKDVDVIEKILKHLGLDEVSQARNRSPLAGWFDHSSRLF